MRPDARLDSAVFQLTPTRTRFDLVLIVNGGKEKIASGLLKPFLAHLKAAQDQIAKGGYSITLEPSSGVDMPWFTRGTVERFVRFVSTPEVLERVTTIESEILQLEDAIAVQSNDSLGLRSVEDQGGKLTESNEGSRTKYDMEADKAIVLYKPGSESTPPMQDDTTMHGENSKVQLLRVLETRKNVLRKEQAMAFARSVAAGFDIDSLGYLIAFAERFGASRLMRACSQFIELWKQKHETGQWIEVEPETMSTRSDFPPFNPSGIIFMGDNVPTGEANGEDAAKADQKSAQHVGYQAAYPPWAMHPPSGAAGYPPYPMQGMPYYPGVNPYYPPYPPADDHRHHYSGRRSSRKHSSDSKNSETLEDGSDHSSSENESSHGRKAHKKGKRSGKKKPSIVVIRNVNVTSKKHGSSESESQTSSDAGSEDSDDSHTKSRDGNHKSSSSKKNGGRKIAIGSGDEYLRDEGSFAQDADQGNWSSFQNFLLKAEEKTRSNDDADLFSGEREPPSSRKKHVNTADPILLAGRDSADFHERGAVGFESANGRTRATRVMSNDELVMSREGRSYMNGEMKEIEAGGGAYRSGTSDDFMMYGQGRQMDRRSSLDPLAEARYRSPTQVDKNGHGVADESFMIPVRSDSHDNLGPESRTAIDIDVELPYSIQKTLDRKSETKLFYEPDQLIPERGFDDASFGYDPAMDYDSYMQVQTIVKVVQTIVKVEDTSAEDVSHSIDSDAKRPEKQKLKNAKDSLDKRKKEALLRRLSAPKTPLNDAQKRAQNLRAYKADLLKLKKEQEDEQMKRLERLKLERQKRIATRSGKDSPMPSREPTNGLSKSVLSFTGVKKEKGGTTEPLGERLKRLAEPKSLAGTDNHSNPKSIAADHSRRRSVA